MTPTTAFEQNIRRMYQSISDATSSKLRNKKNIFQDIALQSGDAIDTQVERVIGVLSKAPPAFAAH